MIIRKSLLLIIILVTSFSVHGQVSVDNTLTVQQLVEDYLIGEGIQVDNITINGDPEGTVNNQAGVYNGPSDVISFDQGVVMATGDANAVVTGGFGDPLTNPITNDPDLVAISGQNMNDVIIIEFDFFSTSDSIKFNYVFASNEYPSYTCSNYNDVFGFFLSGPGISGPYENDAINIALIPDSDIPVGINTVNSGVASGGYSPSTCEAANPNWIEDSQYFVSNTGTPSDDVQFPGLTQTFAALADVDCGEWYHIKLAIGDASDGALDSGVFLEAGSFAAFGEVFVDVSPTVGGIAVTDSQYDSVLVAGCSEAYIQLIRPGGLPVDTVFVGFSGSAIRDQDYELGDNDTLFFFPDGVDTLTFTITTLWDGVPDEGEELTVTIYFYDGCGEIDSAFTSIPFIDPYHLASSTENVIITCPADSVGVTAQASNGIEPYMYDWGDYGVGQNAYVEVPPDSAYYLVGISDACEFEILMDSVLVTNNTPPPLEASIDAFDQPECTNQIMYLRSLVQGGNGDYSYIWVDSLGNAYGGDTLIQIQNINQTILFNPDPTGYTANLPVYLTVIDTCGTMVMDSVVINYPFFDPITVNYPPLTDNCPTDPVELAAYSTGGAGDTGFKWTITDGEGAFADGYGSDTKTTYVVPAGGINEFTIEATDKCHRLSADYQYVNLESPSELGFSGLAIHSDSVRVIKLDNLMNVITPNQDNMNDYFVVEGINYFDNAHLQIFDRWGKVVFETDNYHAGSPLVRSGDAFDGADFAAGTYFYVIDVDNGECVTSGQLEILRTNN